MKAIQFAGEAGGFRRFINQYQELTPFLGINQYQELTPFLGTNHPDYESRYREVTSRPKATAA